MSPVQSMPCQPPEVARGGALLQYHREDLAFDLGPAITFNTATTLARNVHRSTFTGEVGPLPGARRPRLVWKPKRLTVVNAWHIHFWASDALLPAPTLVTRVFLVASRHPGLAPEWPEQMDTRAQMPGERGSSTSRRRTDLRSVCGRLTTDRRRRKVPHSLSNRALHALAHTMFTC